MLWLVFLVAVKLLFEDMWLWWIKTKIDNDNDDDGRYDVTNQQQRQEKYQINIFNMILIFIINI